MNALVYGLGRSGVAAARLLRKQGHNVVAFDYNFKEAEAAALSAFGISFTEQPLKETVDICIAAPGVPYNHPDLQALRSNGVETIGEVEWVYRSVNAAIIGITGTAGKGTVTSWLTHVLSSAGRDAVAGGNIDPALSEVAEDGKLLITELSSFQLERCPTLKPKIAMVLNLDRDHIDRHGNLEAYHEAKRNIINSQDADDTFIYCADTPKLRNWASAARAETLAYGSDSSGNYLDARLQNGTLSVADEPWLGAKDLTLSGQHHHLNALAVLLAARKLGLSREEILPPLKNFAGLPGRFSEIGQLKGVRFVEDSIATRTLAVKAALSASQKPVVWILGGADKGAEVSELLDLAREKVTLALGLGEAGPAFLGQLKDVTATEHISEPDGEKALLIACRRGLEALPAGGTVLLAPLAASFDQFKDYKARAAAFRRAAKRVIEENT